MTPDNHPSSQAKSSGKPSNAPSVQKINALAALFNQGKFDDAITQARVLTQYYPGHGFGWKLMGAALKRQGRDAEALAAMLQAVAVQPDDAEAHKNLGIVLKDLGRLDDAEHCYRQALEIQPDSVDVLNNFGILLKEKGRLAEAENSYRRALQLKPDFAEAYVNLGGLLHETGRMEEALECYQQHEVLVSGNTETQHLIASLTGKNTVRAPVKYIEGLFDNYAATFDEHLQKELRYDIPGKLAALINQHLSTAEKWDVLDLGCGTGLMGVALAPFARQLVGVDLSEKMQEKARERKLYQRLVRADLLPMMKAEAASSFDVIVATDVFVYLGALDEVVAEVGRLLRPGGVFAFSVEDCIAPSKEIEYQLKQTGRYGQSAQYLARLACASGMQVEDMIATQIRVEHGKPIAGHIGFWKKPALAVQAETPSQMLQQAVAHHQAGRLQEAGQLYRAILQTQPGHSEANHNLGALAVQSQRPAEALDYFVAALEADPSRGQYWLSYIDALNQSDQIEAALEVLTMARQHGLSGDDVDALELRLAGDAPAAEQSEADSQAVLNVSHTASRGDRQISKEESNEFDKASIEAVQNRGKTPSAQEVNSLVALFNSGQLNQAVGLAQAMTVCYPQFGFGWKAWGIVLKLMGKNAEALAPMQEALALLPDDPEVHSNMGIALQDLGRLHEAETCFRRALQLNPNYADAYSNLGSALQEMGRIEESVASYRQALAINPTLADAHYNLGNAYRAQGRLMEAADCYRHALHVKPVYVEANCNLGTVLNDLGRLEEAEMILRGALAIKSDHVEVHSNLGNTLKELGRSVEAEASYRRALELDPNVAEVHNNLGNLLQDMGRLDEAEASYRKAVLIKPTYYKAYSNLLFLLNYNPHVAPEIAFEEACKFGRRVGGEVASCFTAWSCAMQPVRLRIGFVSGDFRNHPVGYFLENLLRHLDQISFELIAYPTDPWVDGMTERIKPYFSTWTPLYGLNDEAAARQIHNDGIHILIDLSGHSRHNRLPVFARKPAPVQVSWLGYFATTGVAEIDYLIADPWTLPETEEKFFTEKIWRLPETRLCFSLPDVAVEVSPLPALTNGYIIFGCFNNLAKMNDGVVALWAKVLAAVPGSRLFLKSKQLGEDSVRQNIKARFAVHGIESARLMLEGAESREKYFAAYQRVDIALDPFPYPGGTTTVESLWMGVPVLTLAGQSFLFRQGVGFLTNAGLPEWVADNHKEYIERAKLHAGDTQNLAALRNRLRQQLAVSPIMDGEHFANCFGAAMQGMWQAWYEGSRRTLNLRKTTK